MKRKIKSIIFIFMAFFAFVVIDIRRGILSDKALLVHHKHGAFRTFIPCSSFKVRPI